MRRLLTLLLAITAIGSIGCEFGYAEKITPNKAKWLDLSSKGIAFGTIAGTERAKSSKAKVTYYIRRKDGMGKPQKLVSGNGLFTYLLEPGSYEIYDWALSGAKPKASDSRYEFQVWPGRLTYLGRVVTDLQAVEDGKGKRSLENKPYVIDQIEFDATLFAELYPALTDLDVYLAAQNQFAWK